MRRSTGMGLIGAAGWLGLAALAVLVFVTVHEPIGPFHGSLYGLEEQIGFAWGFAVAGALCGSVTFGLSARARWGIVMALLLAGSLGLIAAGMIFGMPAIAARWYGMPAPSLDLEQRRLISCFPIGTILGLASGVFAALVLAGLAKMSRLLGIRRPWFAMVALLAPANVVSIPFATSRLSELARFLGLRYWSSDDGAILGGSIGATTGAFAGLLLGLLLSRIVPEESPAPPEIPT